MIHKQNRHQSVDQWLDNADRKVAKVEQVLADVSASVLVAIGVVATTMAPNAEDGKTAFIEVAGSIGAFIGAYMFHKLPAVHDAVNKRIDNL